MLGSGEKHFVVDDGDKASEAVSSTSLSLLERAKANDHAAWKRLRDLYVPLVYQWCRQEGVPAADIPDVGQEVFLAVARNLVNFRRDRDGDTFRGWIRAITRNKIADLGRKRGPILPAAGGSDAHEWIASVAEPTVVEDSDQDDPEQSDQQETRLLYARAIDLVTMEYPEWYKTAFLRIIVGGERPVDVAADMGKRASAIYNVKSRILRQLRIEFADALD